MKIRKSTGLVKWYSKEKGYGFVRPDSSGPPDEEKDVFVGWAFLRTPGGRPLREGERVSMIVKPGPGAAGVRYYGTEVEVLPSPGRASYR